MVNGRYGRILGIPIEVTMKLRILLAIALILLAHLSWAGGLMMMGGGVAAVGGEAACTGYADPTGDVTDGSWLNDGDNATDIYSHIDRALRQPDASSLDEFMWSSSMASDTFEVTATNKTSCSTSSVTVWINGACYASNTTFKISISQDGSTYTSTQDLVLPGALGWASATFSGLSWTGGTSSFRIRIAYTDAKNDSTYITAVYAAW